MPKSNTLIKICGLTSEEQALQVAKLGAHAIGIISVEDVSEPTISSLVSSYQTPTIHGSSYTICQS